MRVKLGDIFEIGSGGTPAKSHPEYYNGDIPWVKTGDLKSEYLFEVENFITEEGVENSSAKMYEKDTVLIAMYGATIGATSILKMSACTNQACAAFKKNEKVIPEYLYYFLKSKKEKFVKDGVGGAQPNISVGYLKKTEMELPLLKEQRKIVDILDRISEMVLKRNQEIQLLDDLIKARFVELFGDPRSNPFGFEKKMLKDTCKVITGNTPSRAIAEYYGDYIEWIKTDNIVSGILNPTQATESLSEKGMNVGRTVEKDSILMACIAGSIASIGRVCITDRTVAFNQQINAVVPEQYNILFLYVLLQMSKDYLVEDINMALKGILSKSKLEEKEFIIPPMDLQEQFSDFVKQVDKSKVAVQKALDETQMLFDSLMQKYFA